MRDSVPMCLSLAVLAAAGCRTQAPMELAPGADSAWAYLAEKYDVDRDGRVTEAEYDRAGGSFERLDRDEDGVLTANDYASGRGGMEEMMRGRRAQRTVAEYFQDDDDHANLVIEELHRAIDAYDADGDDAITRAEFDARSGERKVEIPAGNQRMRRMRRMMMEGVEPWSALEAGFDDGDGVLARAEIVGFFTDRDDGDGVWSLDRRGGDRGGARAASGVPEGEMAPDFTLYPPEGGEPVTLSSFRRNLPVALIFGSYT